MKYVELADALVFAFLTPIAVGNGDAGWAALFAAFAALNAGLVVFHLSRERADADEEAT